MPEAVLMPKAGISVESCVIGAWLKKPGDQVKVGDVLFSYETDKAAFECESTAEGVLLAVFYGDGDEVPVLTPVCAVGKAGEDASAIEGQRSANADAAEPARQKDPSDPACAEAGAVAGAVARADSQSIFSFTGKASPRARNLASRLGLDISAASPTGPFGRVIERDVQAIAHLTREGFAGRSDAYSSAGAASPHDSGAQIAVPTHSGAMAVAPLAALRQSQDIATPVVSGLQDSALAQQYVDEKMPVIRRAIASAMTASLGNAAQLTNHHSFDASQAFAYRAMLKTCEAGSSPSSFSGAEKITIGDMVLFATVRTLIDHPYMNAHMIGDDTIRRFSRVNLGVAVDTPRGLMVPTIFGADKMSLLELSKAVKAAAAAARSGSINPDALRDATFTVSNLGAVGVEMFTPILNPPQVGILGVCGVTERVRKTDAGFDVIKSIGLSLTYDHRAVDGAPASRFAQSLCKNLERFTTLLAI